MYRWSVSTECTTASRDSIGNISDTDNHLLTGIHDLKNEETRKITDSSTKELHGVKLTNKLMKSTKLGKVRRASVQAGWTVQCLVKAKPKLRATQSVQQPPGNTSQIQD